MAYHAGMNDEQRHAIQDRFMGCSAGIVVATIAFGMGIDKSNIRAVYHFNLPKSLENFSAGDRAAPGAMGLRTVRTVCVQRRHAHARQLHLWRYADG